jgi:hypothetical protein
MIRWLDNESNVKGKPNENFARELLELFTLGEGNYTEKDVREVARAFTGWGAKDGRFHFDPERHDRGVKEILGRTGRFDGDDVVGILLEQKACARHVARRVLAYFEGVEPSAERLERYAVFLFENDYRVDLFLRQLFLDPDFYRDEVLGARVASPIDYLVGCVRRLGSDPGGAPVGLMASMLGERLFVPPSVKGWERGFTWIQSSPPELPARLAAVLLGEIRVRDLVRAERGKAPDDGAGEALPSRDYLRTLPDEFRQLARLDPRPHVDLTHRMLLAGCRDDADVARCLVDDTLAIAVEPGLVQRVQQRLAQRREALGIAEDELLRDPQRSGPLLREVALEILALPEARLH